jgi:hypothetical protein
MARLKDKLASLDRPRIKITIKSRDGGREVDAYYQRPTEMVDTVLRQAINDEYDAAMQRLKDKGESGKSVHEVIRETYVEKGAESAINTLLVKELGSVRQEAVRILGIDPPGDDASEEEKNRYSEELRPIFDEELERRRDRYRKEDLSKLCDRATELRVSDLASERAQEIYRRSLVAQSIYEEDQDTSGQPTGKYLLAFDDDKDVAENLASDTITTIANRVVEELQKVRSLPLT